MLTLITKIVVAIKTLVSGALSAPRLATARNNRAVTLIEYALLAAVLIVAIAAVGPILLRAVTTLFGRVEDGVQ